MTTTENGTARTGAAKAVLEATHIDFAYGSVQVLFDVSLTLQQGEVLAILGSNGAGKSTILRVLSGLERVRSGTIALEGVDVTRGDARERVRDGLVLVPEVKGIFPDLSVTENLEVGAYQLRKDAKLRRERYDGAFALFPRLAERRKQQAATLSGGERQMLALAKAFLLQPKVLMIDELSLGLSPSIVDTLVETVGELARQGQSIIAVEQSINVASAIATRATIVEKGAVQYDGPMDDLLGRPDLIRAVLLGGHVGEEV